MAICLPVVSTARGSVPELVEDGKSGFLVREKDAAALAEQLRLFNRTPQIMVANGQSGSRICLETL